MTDNGKDIVYILSAQLEEKCAIIHLPAVADSAATTIPQRIDSLTLLNQQLPSICSNIFKSLGSQQRKATYQRCLQLDLEETGLVVNVET